MTAKIKEIFKSDEPGIWKIILENNLEYSWNFENGNKFDWLKGFENGLFIDSNWFSKKDCKNTDYTSEKVYNIEIVYNYKNKPMINIKTIEGYEFRQEVNPWPHRNNDKWISEKRVLI